MTSFTPLPPMDGAVLRNRGTVRRDMAAKWDALWRRKWVPVLGACVGFTVGMGALMFMPPLYKASARIMVDTPAGKNGVVESEAAIVRSTPVLSKVAGTLGLYKDPAFTKPRSVIQHVVGKPQLMDTGTSDRVMNRLDDMIHVRVLPNTSIIDMTVLNRNPERAAQIANALLTAYQERKADERFEQSRQMSAWTGKQLEAIRAQSAQARERLAAFEAAHPQSASDVPAQSQQLAILNREMARTQSDIITLSSRLEAAQKESRAKSADKIVRIQSLKSEESNLSAELSNLRKTYGELHPKIVEQKARLARVQADLRAEARNATPTIDADLNAAKNRLEALRREIDALSLRTDESSRAGVALKTLQDDVAANERLYADFMVKYQGLSAEAQLRGNDIKVISMATIPSAPDQNARIAMVIALALAGFVMGLCFVVLRLAWATGFTTAAQLEGMTGYPVFAAIPAAGGKFGAKGGAVHHNVMQDPAAILAESLRSLRVSLRLRGDTGRRPRVVAFTSTLPEEGKTSLAVMLAMVAAKSGERVCVVDCDLRRPSVHKAFGIGNARGLADYLSDRLSIDDVIYRKDPSGVHLVTAKAVPSYSLTLLTSGRMERLIDNLREQYDLVILDAPSSLAFADARVLARMVDQTMYVVAWNRTRRESVMASLKSYADLGYADLALVLNKVDLSEYLRDSAAVVVYQYGKDIEDAYAT